MVHKALPESSQTEKVDQLTLARQTIQKSRYIVPGVRTPEITKKKEDCPIDKSERIGERRYKADKEKERENAAAKENRIGESANRMNETANMASNFREQSF